MFKYDIGFNDQFSDDFNSNDLTNKFRIGLNQAGNNLLGIKDARNLHFRISDTKIPVNGEYKMDFNFNNSNVPLITKNVVNQFLNNPETKKLKFKFSVKPNGSASYSQLANVNWNIENRTVEVTNAAMPTNAKTKLYQGITGNDIKWTNDKYELKGTADNPMTFGNYTFDQLVKQYWFYMKKVMPNVNQYTRDEVYNMIKFDEKKIIYLPLEDSRVKFGKFVLTSYSLMNSSLATEGSSLARGALVTDVNAANSLKDTYASKLSRPAEIYVAYGLNGEVLNIGGENLFDTIEVIKANIYNSLSPKKSQLYLFIKDYNLPVMNKISNIFKLDFMSETLYFDSNNNLIKYILDYIQNNSKVVYENAK